VIYPPGPETSAVVDNFCKSIRQAQQQEWPYRHWLFTDIFPESLCSRLLALPIVPPTLGRTDGTRNSYNDRRRFITPLLRSKFPSCAVLAEALQKPNVAKLMAETCDIDVAGAFLRIEYIQDTEGAWLEPHRDIPEKLFSMVIYLFTGPDTKEWGTDIYDSEKRWVGQSPGDFNSGVIFVPGENTWHGFEPRPIIGIRRLMEVNYVAPNWRDREQLAFPDRPIRVA
jgi:hypothetical protein